ncbi:MAG: hypothetical protein M5R40_14810 [Anaerolineae bacterium]|nr:hypothetical protein [Anaerolineae bacterium]
MRRRRAAAVWLLTLALFIPGALAAQEPAPLPTDLFTLDQTGRVWRTSPGGGVRVQVSPANQQAADFAVAPGGGWLAYRTGGSLYARALDGDAAPLRLDTDAGPPEGRISGGARSRGRPPGANRLRDGRGRARLPP